MNIYIFYLLVIKFFVLKAGIEQIWGSSIFILCFKNIKMSVVLFYSNQTFNTAITRPFKEEQVKKYFFIKKQLITKC